MKHIIFITLFLFRFFFSHGQGVGINASGSQPDVSAGLDVDFTDKGLLIPRLTTTQRNSIPSPADALQIFNVTSRCVEIYNAHTLSWEPVRCLCSVPLPDEPVSLSATNITQVSFDANWNSAVGATHYLLDVASDAGFSNILPGFSGLGVGNVITYTVSGLSCETTYYYRIRAANSCGEGANSGSQNVTLSSCWSCGDPITDQRDGKVYTTTLISGTSSPYCTGSSQCWMKQNLNAGTRIDGSQNQASGGEDQNSSIEKYCLSNNESNCTTYGGLYQWNELMAYGGSVSGNGPGPRGICPDGWHIPVDNEWRCAEMNLGMSQAQADGTSWRGTDQGNQMKTAGCGSAPLWSCSSAGTNSSGFTGLPAGNRDTGGSYNNIGTYTDYWTATDSGASNAWRRILGYSEAREGRSDDLPRTFGFSVRCVKD